MPYLLSLIIFSLASFTIASTQGQQGYLRACTAILKGFDVFANPKASYDYSFAEWENPYPHRSVKNGKRNPSDNHSLVHAVL